MLYNLVLGNDIRSAKLYASRCGENMQLMEYLNQIYDFDNLRDYKYGK